MTAASAAETRDSDSKARSVVDSAFETAHKVALAGVGVAGEAADAGAKVFDRLVARGEKVESQGRESLGGWRDKAEVKVKQARSVAEKGLEQTKSKARSGFEQTKSKARSGIEQTKSKARSGFEQTKSKARAGIDEHLERRLKKLGVPGKANMEAVIERLSAIEARLEALEKKPKPRRRTTKKAAPAKAK